MTGEEIRAQVVKNNKKIEECLNPRFFTLNKEISELLEENKKLQRICPHEYDDMGYCIFCDKEYK